MIADKAKLTRAYLKDAERAAYTLLDSFPVSISYHNQPHTKDFVYPAAMKIAEREGFSEEEQILVGISALFHDTGFLEKYDENEEIGARFAEEYMEKSQFSYTEKHIETVKKTIMSTNRLKEPENKFQAVLMDADTCLLGSRSYLNSRRTLKEELINNPGAKLHNCAKDEVCWNKKSLDFMETHKFFTESAKKMFDEIKTENISKYKQRYHLD